MGFDKFTMDDYEITREGRVINKRWKREVKPRPNSKGYLRVNIAGKFRFVHRLVAELYVPNPYNKEQVNHIDGNKLNNDASNLEWTTNMENRKHALEHELNVFGEKCSWAQLNDEKVRFIRNHPEIGPTELAKILNVSIGAVKGVKQNKTWKHVV